MKKFIITTLLLFGIIDSAYAQACKILYQGRSSYNTAQSYINNGRDVTATNGLNNLSGYLTSGTLNADYDAIWLHWYNTNLSATDINALQDYVSNGGALYINGEYPGTVSSSYSSNLTNLVNNVLLPASGGGTFNFPVARAMLDWGVNSTSIANIDSFPNVLPAAIRFDAGGQITGIFQPENIVTQKSTGQINTIAFDESDMISGKGRIAAFMDGGNVAQSADNSPAMLLMRNIQQFLDNAGLSGSCRTPVNANDDTVTILLNTAGNVINNVLANDLLNTVIPSLNYVTLTETIGTNTSGGNITLDPTTGSVTVASGTPAGNYTFDYKYCQISDPDNCATATVTVNIVGVIVEANDDAVSAPAGYDSSDIYNVFVNDTHNSDAATPTNTTLSILDDSNSHSGITLDTTTGMVSVTATTPAGFYSIEYQICDVTSTTICDAATLNIFVDQVMLAPLTDFGFALSVPGGIAIDNILENDTLGGVLPATFGNVVVSLAAGQTLPAGISLDTSTGQVAVAPMTPVGDYDFIYQICEIINPTNCETAEVYVGVRDTVVRSEDDSFEVLSSTGASTDGSLEMDIINNDELITSAGIIPADTSNVLVFPYPLPAGISLTPSSGGTVPYLVTVAPGTPVGFYNFDYQIMDSPAFNSIDISTVTVSVIGFIIKADDDSGQTLSTGGIAVNNVLTNDTIDGVTPTLADITLQLVSTDHSGISLDTSTGSVNVAAGTPAGVYTLTYQICEKANPSHCEMAVATITVTAVIKASDDTGTVSSTGGIAVNNVLTNDTIDGVTPTLADITLQMVSTDHSGISLDTSTGSINVAAGTPAGVYTLTYQICEKANNNNCKTARVTITVGTKAVVTSIPTSSVFGLFLLILLTMLSVVFYRRY